MKKTSKILMVFLVLIMVISLSGCGRNSAKFNPDPNTILEIEGIDHEAVLDEIIYEQYFVIDIESDEKVGVRKSATFVEDDEINFYSTNEAIATVDDEGNVIGKSEGACYVIEVSESGAFYVNKVMVDAPAEIDFIEIWFIAVPVLGVVIVIIVILANRTHKPEMPKINTPNNQVPMYNGYGGQNQVNRVNTVAGNNRVCPHCGQPTDGAFCPYCGGKLN